MSPVRPTFVAIAGGSGSGKSTLATALRDALGPDQAVLLHHDAYYRDLSGEPMAARAHTNFDSPTSLDNELLAEHLDALAAGSPCEEIRYDFVTHTRQPSRRKLEPKRFVILEGILLLSVRSFARRFDLRVFVDAPADLRFIRRQNRDVAERGRTWQSVRDQYLESVRPMHERFVEPSRSTADLVVSGVGDLAVACRTVHDAALAAEAGVRGGGAAATAGEGRSDAP